MFLYWFYHSLWTLELVNSSTKYLNYNNTRLSPLTSILASITIYNRKVHSCQFIQQAITFNNLTWPISRSKVCINNSSLSLSAPKSLSGPFDKRAQSIRTMTSFVAVWASSFWGAKVSKSTVQFIFSSAAFWPKIRHGLFAFHPLSLVTVSCMMQNGVCMYVRVCVESAKSNVYGWLLAK